VEIQAKARGMSQQPNPDDQIAATAPSERRTMMIKIGGLTLRGPAAAIFLLLIGALLVVLIVRMHPRTGMLVSWGLWIAFIAYWSVAAKNSAAAKSSESKRSRSVHELLLNGGLLLLFVPVWGLAGHFLPRARSITLAGLGVQAAFFLLAWWSRRHLGRNWSTKVRIAEEHELVRSGPYRLVRHPIYTAMLGMSLGTTIVSGQYHSLLGLLIIAIAYWRKIRIEESALGEAFGAEYDEYRRRSWALIPVIF
jgi:protein-S-isoprenylcysteine O-methyltransferase Ste14